MLCFICNSPQIERKQVNGAIYGDFDIIYGMICMNCGERYYDRKTIQYLERMKNKLHAVQQQLIQQKNRQSYDIVR